MTSEQLGILGSLLTFAAENIPGGLKPDEAQAVQNFHRWSNGGEFYSLDIGSSSIKLQNDGKVLASFKVDEHNQRRLEAHILGPQSVSIKVAPGDHVEIDNKHGSLVMVPVRVVMDAKTVEWVLERFYPMEKTWSEVARVPGQLSTDFHE